MKQMSEYVGKLEGYAELEVSIIRATKINKVLKAILKLDEIPKESDFKFKARSQSLLEKWNIILESDTPQNPAASVQGTTNNSETKEMTNGTSKSADTDIKTADTPASESTGTAPTDAATDTKAVDTDSTTNAKTDSANESVEVSY